MIKRAFSSEADGRTDRPDPLKILYIGLEPLPKALPRAVHLAGGRLLGRDCDRFLFAKVRNNAGTMDFVYWLDRATGMPLKVEYYPDERACADGRPIAAWAAESLDDVEGRHLALRSEFVHYDPAGASHSPPRNRYRLAVDEVHFDRDYPEAMFWPKITADTMVVDMIKNRIDFPKVDPKAQTEVADPIRAVEPGGWVPTTSAVSLIVGAIIIVTALLLRRRG